MTRLTLVLTSLSLFFCSCSEEPEPRPDYPVRLSVTLLTSTGGNGDNGYNDLILSGVMRYYNAHEDEVELSLRHPGNNGEARDLIQEWTTNRKAVNGPTVRSLLLLASSDYEEPLKEVNPELEENQRILLFENDGMNLPDGVSSFRIGRYGASFLAGLMAEESPEAYIVSACPDNGILKDAEQGFAEGYRMATQGKTPAVEYISDNEAGFSMPEKAYDIVRNMEEAFIFPLAGGSNNGIYRYSREDFFTLQLIAGMDVDCSEFSTRIPFSMTVHIDGILEHLLEEWHANGEMPVHTDYFTDEGVEISINPFFLERANIFLDYYEDPDYWRNQKEKWMQIALEMERRYYGK